MSSACGRTCPIQTKEHVIGTAVLKLPRHHWFAEKLFASAQQIVRSKGAGAQVKWAEIGPTLLTRLVQESGLAASVEPHHRFYPIGWHEYQVILLPEEHERVVGRTRESVLVHLWSEMFRRNAVDPSGASPGSWLAAMFAKHGCRDVEISAGISVLTGA